MTGGVNRNLQHLFRAVTLLDRKEPWARYGAVRTKGRGFPTLLAPLDGIRCKVWRYRQEAWNALTTCLLPAKFPAQSDHRNAGPLDRRTPTHCGATRVHAAELNLDVL